MISLRTHWRPLAVCGAAAVLVCGVAVRNAIGSDHADTPEITAAPGGDLTDVHIFPSPTDSSKVVLSMCVNPLIPSGQGLSASFNPNLLYQFKIDNTGDAVEDLVIQAKFEGTGAGQSVFISGPVAPARLGAASVQETPNATVGTLNSPFTLTNGVQAFAGAREDPFFFDLERFGQILPDRVSTITNVPDPTPNTPKASTWRNPGIDFLTGYNVLAIVVEVPKSMLQGAGAGQIGVWCTTSR